jgi:HAD superfamily hydrolase (TIGR01509 family)
VRALVFDYDGLIVDSETPEYESWRFVFEAHGQRLAVEDWARVVGGAAFVDMRRELEGRLGRSIRDWERHEARRVEYCRALFEKQELLPGVRRLFEEGRRRGWALGVASNSPSAWVLHGLRRFGLETYVGALRALDTARRPKPHPDPYLEVLAELGGIAARSFAFEDSAPGVAAARAAGLTVVAVPNRLTRHHDLGAAHHVLESLEQFQLPE